MSFFVWNIKVDFPVVPEDACILTSDAKGTATIPAG
jgi:hypothetical protein